LGFRLKKDKMEALAKLKNYPTSPRKMRLLADEIRGLPHHYTNYYGQP